MSINKKEWFYAAEFDGRLHLMGPVSINELDDLHRQGEINDYSEIMHKSWLRQNGPHAEGHRIYYNKIPRNTVEFCPSIEEFHEARSPKPITVLSGPNNSGKSLLLKRLYSSIGQGGYFLNCSRYSSIDTLNYRRIENDEHLRYYDNFVQNFYNSNQNIDHNDLQLEQIITSLKNSQREKLFAICYNLLGNKFSLKKTDEENDFSPFYIDMDGENLRYGSSGTRLLLTLLGILLDERFSFLFIDEPELGLSPRIQASLARFLYHPERREEFCPHIRQIYIATHSHLFLDRKNFSNNFIVTKDGSTISIKQVQAACDFHQLQFNMLGNEMESIFLPSAIIVVEGTSDVIFLNKIMQLHLPENKVAIVRANGDGKTPSVLNYIKDTLGDLDVSPYKHRLFVVFDKIHSTSLSRIYRQGVIEEHVIEWPQNGIEYIYPQELLAAEFHCDIDQLKSLEIDSDHIILNDIKKAKTDLAYKIIEKMSLSTRLHPELERFISLVRKACT